MLNYLIYCLINKYKKYKTSLILFIIENSDSLYSKIINIYIFI
jgi:hypothetical protein